MIAEIVVPYFNRARPGVIKKHVRHYNDKV